MFVFYAQSFKCMLNYLYEWRSEHTTIYFIR